MSKHSKGKSRFLVVLFADMYKRWVAGEIKGEHLHRARVELIQLCDRAFSTKTREEWVDIFQRHGVWHEKVSIKQP